MFNPDRSQTTIGLAFGLVLAADLAGLLVALTTGIAGAGEALVTGTPLNAPFTFVTVQGALVAAILLGGGKRRGRAAAATLAVLGVVSVVSGFFDGGYAAAGYELSLAERGLQAAIVAGTLAMTAAAVTRVMTPATAPGLTAS